MKNFQCDQCDPPRPFKTQHGLNDHRRRVHGAHSVTGDSRPTTVDHFEQRAVEAGPTLRMLPPKVVRNIEQLGREVEVIVPGIEGSVLKRAMEITRNEWGWTPHDSLGRWITVFIANAMADYGYLVCNDRDLSEVAAWVQLKRVGNSRDAGR